MPPPLPISVVIKGKDELSAKLRGIAARLNHTLGPAFKRLDRVNATFGAGFDRTAKKIALLGGAVAGAAVAGITKLVLSHVELGSRIHDVAKKTGISTDAIQKWRIVAGQAGSSAEGMDAAMAGAGLTIGELKAKTGRAYTFLKKHEKGLLANILAAKDTDTQFRVMVTALTQVKDASERAKLAAVLFKGAGDDVATMAGEGAAELEKLYDAAQVALTPEQVDRADALGDSLATLKGRVVGLLNQAIAPLVPKIEEAVNGLVAWLAEGDNAADVAKRFGDALSGLWDWLSSIDWKGNWETIKRWGGYVRDAWDAVGGLHGALAVLAGLFAGRFTLALVNVGAAVLKLGIIFMMNPIALIATAVAGAAILIWKYWEPIKGFFADMWDGIIAVFTWAEAKINAVMNAIRAGIEWIRVNSGDAFGLPTGETNINLGQAQQDVMTAGRSGAAFAPMAAAAGPGGAGLWGLLPAPESKITVEVKAAPGSAAAVVKTKGAATVFETGPAGKRKVGK